MKPNVRIPNILVGGLVFCSIARLGDLLYGTLAGKHARAPVVVRRGATPINHDGTPKAMPNTINAMFGYNQCPHMSMNVPMPYPIF